MGKFFLRLFLIILIVIVSVAGFLTYFGLETDRFDNLIKNKTNEMKEDLLKGRLYSFTQNIYHLWLAKKLTSSKISNPYIEKIYN